MAQVDQALSARATAFGITRAEAKSGTGPLLGEIGSELSLEERQQYADEISPQRDEVLQLHGSGDLRLYERLLRDDQVATTFQQRRTSGIANAWQVDAGGDAEIDQLAADDLREQVADLSFDRITYKMLAGLLYGYAVGECLYRVEGTLVRLDDVRVRRARRFRFATDGGLMMIEPDRVRMPEQKFWVYTCGADDDDNPYGQGLGHWLYWPVWFKRNAHRFWALWLEKFASPTPVAQGRRGMTDAEERELLSLLQAITHGGRLVIPEGVTVDLIESARNSDGNYNIFVDKMDSSIAKVVLSQTMTTDDGSSKSQADVHLKVRQTLTQADSDLVMESFSKGPARWLTEWNWPGAAVPHVYRKAEAPQDLKALADRDAVLAGMGFPRSPEYMTETYGDGFATAATADNPEGP